MLMFRLRDYYADAAALMLAAAPTLRLRHHSMIR